MTSKEWRQICAMGKTAEWAIKNRQPAPRIPRSIVHLDRKTYYIWDDGSYRKSPEEVRHD